MASGEEAAIATKNVELGFCAFPLFRDSERGLETEKDESRLSPTMHQGSGDSNWTVTTELCPQQG